MSVVSNVLWQPHGQRVIADGVYLIDKVIEQATPIVAHMCNDAEWLHEMTLRENETGPLYWCTGCGYTLEEGLSMAIRLNEVDI